MKPIIIESATLPGQDVPVDLLIKDGKIAQMGPDIIHEDAERIHAKGLSVMPPFAEAHTHLDTAFAAEEIVNESGTLAEGIAIWQTLSPKLTQEAVREKAWRVISRMITEGILSFRVMVDVSNGQLTALKTLTALRDETKDLIDLQLIAFPQNGIHSNDDGARHLTAAFNCGADGISAVPHLEESKTKGSASIRTCFELAKAYDKPVHIFADETDEDDSHFTLEVARQAIAWDWADRTTVSHASAMEYYTEEQMAELIETVKASGIHLVTCPTVNSVMNGRNKKAPAGRGVMRVKELIHEGIPVACAHDDFQSPFYPLGTGSILKSANLLVHLAQLTGEDELKEVMAMIGDVPRKLMGLPEKRITVGERADFLLIEGESPLDWLRKTPSPRYVFQKGRILAHTPESKPVLTIPQAKKTPVMD